MGVTAMTRTTQGNGGPDGRPLCFNGEPPQGYLANDGWTEDGRRRTVLIPWAFSQACKSWASHPGTPPVPLVEGWKCNGCRHFPGQDVQAAVFHTLTRDP
jgi:hypothetical protein